ncbi:hypothetical protein T484DRAFT_1767787 [Baffinella frigidus]|nr:hypothetical protein T484DRAFT_1767787 [Cryptophyta sp. CCMP2293]
MRQLSTVCLAACLAISAGSALHSMPTVNAAPLGLRGGGTEIKRMTSQDVIAVYSKKDRLSMTLTDWMRDKTLADPANQDLETIFQGIQVTPAATPPRRLLRNHWMPPPAAPPPTQQKPSLHLP